jgi:hypothetical protein
MVRKNDDLGGVMRRTPKDSDILDEVRSLLTEHHKGPGSVGVKLGVSRARIIAMVKKHNLGPFWWMDQDI